MPLCPNAPMHCTCFAAVSEAPLRAKQSESLDERHVAQPVNPIEGPAVRHVTTHDSRAAAQATPATQPILSVA